MKSDSLSGGRPPTNSFLESFSVGGIFSVGRASADGPWPLFCCRDIFFSADFGDFRAVGRPGFSRVWLTSSLVVPLQLLSSTVSCFELSSITDVGEVAAPCRSIMGQTQRCGPYTTNDEHPEASGAIQESRDCLALGLSSARVFVGPRVLSCGRARLTRTWVLLSVEGSPAQFPN